MKTYTILIADDYPENLQIIVEALQSSNINHKVIRAVNGKVLCELAEKRIPDLIITDWEMPVMDGIDAIKYLKNLDSTKDIPIIMCTGIMTTSQNLKMALDSGAVDFIKKPIDSIELQARVNSMLRLGDSYRTIKEQNLKLENQKEEIIAQKDEIERQHLLIQRKNFLINSSIQYAQTIQNAILPPTCLIDSIGESFIVYKPKDIVSGDLYWYADLTDTTLQAEELNNANNLVDKNCSYKFFAVVDCTGHGVPGAFMSMIANTLLNEIVFSMKIVSPALILKKLQKKIKATLHQVNSSNDDGMDIGICRFEKKGSENCVTFSGAKHSLYYSKYPHSELNVVKGSRATIGGFLSEKNDNYDDTSLVLKPNDILYMFTDGAICGIDEQGQKLGTTNLLETLTQNMNLPIELQKQKVEMLYTNNKQLDDITLVGLKLR